MKSLPLVAILYNTLLLKKYTLSSVFHSLPMKSLRASWERSGLCSPATYARLKELFFSQIFVELNFVGIFAISLLLDIILLFFNSVQLFYNKMFAYCFTEHGFCPPELRSVGIFRISLTFFKIERFWIFNFFTVRLTEY